MNGRKEIRSSHFFSKVGEAHCMCAGVEIHLEHPGASEDGSRSFLTETERPFDVLSSQLVYDLLWYVLKEDHSSLFLYMQSVKQKVCPGVALLVR
jgi:hypothetical protein